MESSKLPTRARRMRGRRPLAAWIGAAALLCACSALAQAPAPEAPLTPGSPSRGRLLYETHCIACHNSQMHWRDQRIATDWDGLVAQVRGWQARASLFWSEDDIAEVARHLNEIIYRFERPLPPRAQAVPARRGAG